MMSKLKQYLSCVKLTLSTVKSISIAVYTYIICNCAKKYKWFYDRAKNAGSRRNC